MQASAAGADVLNVDLIRHDVKVVEAEVMIGDEAAVGRLDVVEARATRTRDDEARVVSFDLHVLHDVVVTAEAK